MAESSSSLPPHSETPSPASPTSSAPDSAEKTSRRRRGRPEGSKNKPKQPLLITRQPEPAFKTVQFKLPLGCDIVEMLEKFARMNQVGLHVLDGSGCVSNLALQNTSSVPSGVLYLATLSGTFMDPTMMASSSSTAIGTLLSSHTSGPGPWLRVIATGSSMEVCGGIVSRVQAATDVVVYGLAFKSSEPKRLDPADYATISERDGPSSGSGFGGSGGGSGSGLVVGGGSGGAVGGGGVAPAPPGFGAPTPQQNWTATIPECDEPSSGGGSGGIGGGFGSGIISGGGSGGAVGGVGVAPAPPGFGAPTPRQNWTSTIPEREGSGGGGSGGIGDRFGSGLIGDSGSGGAVGGGGVAPAPPGFGFPTPQRNWTKTIPECDGPSSGGGSGGIGGGFGSGLIGRGGSGGAVGGGGVVPTPPGFGAPTPQQNWGFRI